MNIAGSFFGEGSASSLHICAFTENKYVVAQVKMADGDVKRVTVLNSITTPGMQSLVRSPETSAPIQDQRYYQHPSNNHFNNLIPPNTTVDTMGTSVPMQTLADSEHMQKHTCEGASSYATGEHLGFIQRSWH